jgi:hypothetical protein
MEHKIVQEIPIIANSSYVSTWLAFRGFGSLFMLKSVISACLQKGSHQLRSTLPIGSRSKFILQGFFLVTMCNISPAGAY